MSDVTYIRITTSSGVISGDSGTWIPVSDLVLSTQNPGKTLNGGLNFTLWNDDAIGSQLNQSIDSNTAFLIEVATYDDSTATSTSPGTLVSYAQSSGAKAILQTSSGTTNANTYALALANISQTTFPNGSVSSSAYVYPTTSKPAGATAMAASVPTGVQSGSSVQTSTSKAPDFAGLTYYAQFATSKNADGTVNYLTSATGGTWFAISGVSTGLSNPDNGAVNFSALSFNITDQAASSALFVDGLRGDTFYAVQVESLRGSIVVDNTTYETVSVGSLTSAGDVALGYSAYYHQHFRAMSKPSIDGWDQATNKIDTGGYAIPAVSPTNVSAGQTTNGYFLAVKGFVGDAPAPTDARSMKLLAGASTGFVPLGASFSAVGASSSGSSSLSDLQITSSSQILGLHADSLLLTRDLDAQFTLVNYSNGTATGSDRFSELEATHDDLDLVLGTHTMSFSYQRISNQYYTSTSGNNTATVNYDLKTAMTSAAPVARLSAVAAERTFSANSTSSSSASAGSVRSDEFGAKAPSTNTAYIQFRDANGNVISSSSGQSWFAVSSASTGFSQTAAFGSGAGATKVSIGDLQFGIGQDAISGTLDTDLVAGTQLTAEVATYSGSSALQSDYVFGNGTISSHTGSFGSSEQIFTFSPSSFQETQYASGSSIGTVTYDTSTTTGGTVPRQTSYASKTEPMTLNASPRSDTSYVQFVGSNGIPLRGSSGSTWFQVTSAPSGLSAHTNPSTGARIVNLGNLTISIGDDPVTSQLDAALFDKTTLQSVNVATYNPNGTLESTQSYGSATIGATTVANTGGEHSYEFTYTGYGETINPTPSTNSASVPLPSSATAGTTTMAPALDPSANIRANSAPSLSTLSFYAELKAGASSAPLFVGSSSGFIALPGFSINLSGSSASFDVDQTQAAVIAATLNGGTSAQLEIAGYNSSGRSVDYVLSGVSLLSSSVDPTTGLDSVELQYTSLQETKTGANKVYNGPAARQTSDAPANAAPSICFASGTLIRTSRGDVAVEELVVDDLVVIASGEHRPIRWLCHRTLDCRRHPRPHDAMPIRIAAHAFGEARPARDLWLSPGHPVLVGADEDGQGGHLVPIMCLINGTTIERVAVDEVTYWHIEIDEHDILLAEGLPAESYIDLGSRPWFAGADGALYNPDMARPGMPGRCRPVAIEGPVVEAERRRLDQVFAMRLAFAAAWPEEASTGDWAAA